MARARGEHIPWVAYTLPGPGACTACHARCILRTAVILPAHVGCLRALLCATCAAEVALFGTTAGTHADDRLGFGKRCPHCGRVWPRDTRAWHRNRTTRDGLESWCKACKSWDSRRRQRRRSGSGSGRA